MYRYLKELEGRGKPVVLTGDLNVAHLDLDIHNPTAKHIAKQAGLTPQERTSFGTLLATGFQDALRFFYPGEKFPLPILSFKLILCVSQNTRDSSPIGLHAPTPGQ